MHLRGQSGGLERKVAGQGEYGVNIVGDRGQKKLGLTGPKAASS